MVITVWPLILLPAPNPINYTIVYHFMVFRIEGFLGSGVFIGHDRLCPEPFIFFHT
jgi:hypothetical protein